MISNKHCGSLATIITNMSGSKLLETYITHVLSIVQYAICKSLSLTMYANIFF